MFGHNPQIIFCHFFHKMNLVIFATKVNRYEVSCVLSCFMIAHIFKDKHKVAGDINSLNLLVLKHVSSFLKVLAKGILISTAQ